MGLFNNDGSWRQLIAEYQRMSVRPIRTQARWQRLQSLLATRARAEHRPVERELAPDICRSAIALHNLTADCPISAQEMPIRLVSLPTIQAEEKRDGLL